MAPKKSTERLEKTKFENLTTGQKINKIKGFQLVNGSIKFEIGGSKRSFKLRAIKSKLKKCKTSKQVKELCYKTLLEIITKDGSIKTNKYSVENFEKSNKELQRIVKEIKLETIEIAVAKNALIKGLKKERKNIKTPIAETNEKKKNTIKNSQKPLEHYAKTTGTPHELKSFENMTEAWTPAVELLKVQESLQTWFDKNTSTPNHSIKIEKNGYEFSLIWEDDEFSLYGKNKKELIDEKEIVNEIIRQKKMTPEEEKTFKLQTKKRKYKYEKQQTRTKGRARRDRKSNELLRKNFKFDSKAIGYEDYEGDIALYWNQWIGHKKVDTIFSSPPFNIDSLQLPTVISKMISIGKNTRIDIGDIFKTINEKGGFSMDAKSFPNTDMLEKYKKSIFIARPKTAKYFHLSWKDAPKMNELLKDGKEFSEAYINLEKLYNEMPHKKKDKEKIKALLDTMHESIIAPCLEGLEAISQMKRPDGKKIKKDAQESLLANFAEKEGVNKDFVTLTPTLFEEQDETRKSNLWEEFIAYCTRETTMSMSIMNGQTADISKGHFTDFYNPEAALLNLANTKGLYKFDKNNNREIDEPKMVSEILRITNLGITSEYIREALAKNPKLKTKINELKTSLGKFKGIKTIKGLMRQFKETPDLIKTFQLGFIDDQSSKFEKQMSIEAIIKGATPEVQEILKEMKYQEGITKQDLIDTKTRLTHAGTIGFNIKSDGSAGGAGYGKSFKINDKISLGFGISAQSGKIPINAGASMTVSLYKDGKHQVDLTPGIGISGAALRAVYKVEVDDKGTEVSVGLGTAATWTGLVIPFADVRVDWTTQKAIDHRKEKRLNEKLEKTSMAKFHKEWSTLSSNEKLKKIDEYIEKIPELKKIKLEIKQNHGTKLENMDVVWVNAIDSFLADIEIETLNEESVTTANIIGGVGVGYAFASTPTGTHTPIAGIKFQIGSYNAFIPFTKEKDKLVKDISAEKTELQLKKWMRNANKNKMVFIEASEANGIMYDPSNSLGIGIKQGEDKVADLRSIKPSLKKYNEQLSTAEVKLRYDKTKNRTELIFQGLDKRTEVSVDPLIAKTLNLIIDKTNNKLYLEGEIDDLIITRERFSYPFALVSNEKHGKTKQRECIVDYVTIKQTASIKANIDSEYIRKYQKHYVVLEPGKTPVIQDGLNSNANFDSPITEKSGKIETPERIHNALSGNTEKSNEYFNIVKEDIEKRKRSITNKNAFGLETNSRKNKNIVLAVKKYTESNPTFKAKIGSYMEIGKDISLARYIIAAWPKIRKATRNNSKLPGKLSISQVNDLMTTLPDAWFIESKGNNQKLIKSIEKTMSPKGKIFKEFKKRFKNAIKRLNLRNVKNIPENDASRYVSILMKKTYKPLIDALRNGQALSSIKTKEIKAGSTVISGSRTKRGARSLARILNYKPENQIPGYGFLENSIQKFSLQSQNENIKNIAKILMEITHPLPEINDVKNTSVEKWHEFFSSPFVLQAYGIGAYRLLCTSQEYNDVTSLIKSMAKGRGKETIKKMLSKKNKRHNRPEALVKFVKFVKDLKKAQLNGKLYERTIQKGELAGSQIKINMSKMKIQSGAYSKCTNPTFAVTGNPIVSISKPIKVKGTYNKSTMIVDRKLTRVYAYMDLIGSVSHTKAVSKKQKDGKNSDDGRNPEAEKPGKPVAGDKVITPDKPTVSTNSQPPNTTTPDIKVGDNIVTGTAGKNNGGTGPL